MVPRVSTSRLVACNDWKPPVSLTFSPQMPQSVKAYIVAYPKLYELTACVLAQSASISPSPTWLMFSAPKRKGLLSFEVYTLPNSFTMGFSLTAGKLLTM